MKLSIVKSASIKICIIIGLLACLFIFPGAVGAGDIKIIPEDGAADDKFGKSVAISGDYAIIGSPYNDDNVTNSGSAYIFYHSDGAWTQQAKLTASDPETGDEFGYSVAISGDYAIVGARYDDDNGNSSGSVYIFERSGTSWTEQVKLIASDGASGDRFGASVAISGDYAIVGAAYDDADNRFDSGSAYIFNRSGGSWTQQAKLTADDGADDDWFGTSVAISGDYAVVGADNGDSNVNDSGAVYIFHRIEASWTQQAKLMADDTAAGDRFGGSVAISGEDVVVGARKAQNNGNESGSAYIFHRSEASWTQQAKLTANDAAPLDLFGISVAISGNDVIVGVDNDDDRGSASGSAYIFHRSGTSWIQQSKIIAHDASENDLFGHSVGLSGDYAIVGAYGNDFGAAYIYSSSSMLAVDFGLYGLYRYDGTDWTLLTDSDPTVMLAADTDLNSTDELYAVFAPGGVFVFDNEIWTQLTPAVAQNIIRYNSGIAADFGAGGIFTYNGAWTQLTQADPDKMIAVNIDGSGDDELAATFSGSSGLYLYDGAVWTLLTAAATENILEYNGKLVADFGAGGLYLWDNTSWTQLTASDAGLMISADIQGDAAPELVVHFSSGVYYYDGSAWSVNITATAPQDMIVCNGMLYADFGAGGLHEYDGNSGFWTQITTSDAVCLAVADTDNNGTDELAAGFSGGVFSWNGSAWGAALTTATPEEMTGMAQ